MLLGLRITGRRLRRTTLSVASIAVTAGGIIAVLAIASRARLGSQLGAGTGLARALGATPEQVTAGLVSAQVLPAFAGAVLGIPFGIGLSVVAQHGGTTVTYPPVAGVLAVLAGTSSSSWLSPLRQPMPVITAR